MLVDELIERLNDPYTNEEQAEILYAFLLKHNAEQIKPLTIRYIQLKQLVRKENNENALTHYLQYLPRSYSLTKDEYFQLGSAMLAQGEQNKNYFDEALELFYQGYLLSETSGDEARKGQLKNLIINLLQGRNNQGRRSGVKFFHGDSESSRIIFENFLLQRHQKRQGQYQANLQMIEQLKGFYFCRKNAMHDSYLISLFSSENKPAELTFINQIIQQLEEGVSLTEQFKNPIFERQLKSYTLLKKFIIEELLKIPSTNISAEKLKISH